MVDNHLSFNIIISWLLIYFNNPTKEIKTAMSDTGNFSNLVILGL